MSKKMTFALAFCNRGFMPGELIYGARDDMVKAVTDAGYGASPKGAAQSAAPSRDEDALAEAVRRGDGEALRGALGRLLATPEGQRLFRELGSMTGKGRG